MSPKVNVKLSVTAGANYFQAPRRRYMTEILPIRRKTLSSQSIQAPHNAHIFEINNLIGKLS